MESRGSYPRALAAGSLAAYLCPGKVSAIYHMTHASVVSVLKRTFASVWYFYVPCYVVYLSLSLLWSVRRNALFNRMRNESIINDSRKTMFVSV